jgi:hypothetical protein
VYLLAATAHQPPMNMLLVVVSTSLLVISYADNLTEKKWNVPMLPVVLLNIPSLFQDPIGSLLLVYYFLLFTAG